MRKYLKSMQIQRLNYMNSYEKWMKKNIRNKERMSRFKNNNKEKENNKKDKNILNKKKKKKKKGKNERMET